MDEKRYKLRFLPLFEEDLNGIVDYISLRLGNPVAAEDLVDRVERAIYERLAYPEAFAPYRSTRDRPHPYYWIPVKNYMIFYVIIGDVMEVRRILYSRRDLSKEL